MNQLRTVVLLGLLSSILIGVGGWIGGGALYGFVALAVVINLGGYFFSDRIVLAMHHARELGPAEAPRVHGLVADVALSAGIPKPRVFLVEDAQPNAFATGRSPAKAVVAVTQGLLDLLTERELRGVLAHEIAHIRNRDILVATIAAGIAAAITYLAHFAAFFGGGRDEEGQHGSILGTIAMVLLAPFAAALVQLGISRSREYLADDTAARS